MHTFEPFKSSYFPFPFTYAANSLRAPRLAKLSFQHITFPSSRPLVPLHPFAVLLSRAYSKVLLNAPAANVLP